MLNAENVETLETLDRRLKANLTGQGIALWQMVVQLKEAGRQEMAGVYRLKGALKCV